RAPIGYLAISEVPVAVNQGFAAMKCEGRLSQHYMLIWCQMNQELVLSKANGSTFLEISKSNFKSLPVLVPDAGTRDAFDRFAGPLRQRYVLNVKENQTLAALRDLLLPKLMSGELRLRDAEKIIEGAA
ncbi:MAG: restriction endonuclease subunit S, partial [Clostridia bacterium]|nr:restriction endonuclease subunit S [Clostridia bacterium]